MQSSSQPLKPRRFDASRRTAASAGPKAHGAAFQREDKNMNTITTPSPRRATKGPSVPTRTRVAVQPRAPISQNRFSTQKASSTISKTAKPKPKSARTSAVTKIAPKAAPPPLPSVLPLDPNCNEPSLPCLCCDGRSPQDNNSMFNHNHNNNNTISIRQQLQLPPPPPAILPQRHDGKGAKEQSQPASEAHAKMEPSACPTGLENEGKNTDECANLINKKHVKVEEDDDEEESSGDIDIDDDDEADNDDDDDDDDDDTLVPSCCDCPPSLLEFSLSSSTSSSSTSISSCSDLESDCADQSASICSSHDQDDLSMALSPKAQSLSQALECQPPLRSPPSLPLSNPFSLTSHSRNSPCSPDEGYPSALDSPSPDYLGVKGDSEVAKLGLLDFLESVGEFGKMERFSQVIQVARWDLEGEQHWDVLRDRLDHLDRLEKVNREVKLAYIARLHEKGFDLGDLEEQDLSDVMDEMGNIDIPWKLYKSRGVMGESQEFSDAGVDLTAPSDCEDPLAPDSLTPSPVEPPPRPPKPPVRHASVSSDLHTYINISRETTSMAVSTSPTMTTFSPNSSSPTFTTFRCEKPLPPSPPSIPPLPTAKPVPYLTLYTTPSPPPAIHTPTPPIPPPRKRHLARKEAQRIAALQAKQEKTPFSLPPPTTRPPPLPPPPVISVSSSSPPAIPPPPALPPPPSFHTLDVEIRKLLMLAGLTQAELLKLSPELGVCVGGLEDEGEGNNPFSSRSVEAHEFRLKEQEEEEKECDTEMLARDTWSSRGKLIGDGRADVAEEGRKTEENKDLQKTTSFTEMARRRKRNNGVTSDHYYSTNLSNTHETKTNKMNYESFQYHTVFPDSPPPPPPPRPLPPIPSSHPPLKVSTLSANSAQPERFDWLIAFTPECEGSLKTRTLEMRKSPMEAPKKLTSSGSSTGVPPKTTTFKELRYRNKSASPPTKVITDPDPDPTVITPDADILYNLRWRREKEGSDGQHWEYTSQAQAFFMQPPPALTSMAALKEMLQRADKEGGQLELCPSQKIGCSISDSSLWTIGREWECEHDKSEEKEGKEEEEKKVEVKLEVRGRADGGRTFESRTSAVRSVSFAGTVQRTGTSWMGEDVDYPMRGLGLSSLFLQEKKALVSAVSVAVEAILAQFSSSRTVVQKALSGDSTINPSLGRLVLQCLCPALHSLLTDGLKPHQSDLIAGRRPNSAWGLVQASTQPGPKTQALFNLQVRVRELPQLRQSKQRFNAFLLGLLNTKRLDFWLSHIQSCSDVLETYYRPTSFMRLSLSACQPLFEELLLVLQPLSLLTFNLDLLFQHHHLEPDSHRPEIPSPPSQDAGSTEQSRTTGCRYIETLSEVNFESPELKAAKETTSAPINPKNGGSGESAQISAATIKVPVSLAQTSPQLMWVQEKEIGALPPPEDDEDSLAQQAGQVIQQGWGAVMRLGGRLSRNLSELSLTKDEVKTDLSDLQIQTESDFAPVSCGTQVPWGLGRLFGASKSPNSPPGNTPPTRRPSQWLAPGVTALTRMVSSNSTPLLRRAAERQIESEPEREKDIDALEMKDKPRPLRSVRTLCDHTGTGSELSFCKGEELVVLGGVDQDWIRCRQGDMEGLVPIGYTSLIM